MSTKTSFKRIAAVAAVALTLGGFSAVSANAAFGGAAVAADYAGQSSITLGASNVLVLRHSFVTTDAAGLDTMTVNISVPSGGSAATNTALPFLANGGSGSIAGLVNGGTTANNNGNPSTGSWNSTVSPTTTIAGTNTMTIVNTTTGLIQGQSLWVWTPTAVGSYSATVTESVNTASGTAQTATYTWSFTVVAPDTAIALTSSTGAANVTSLMVAGDTTTVGSADATVAVLKTASSTAAATIVVTPVNAAGTSVTSGLVLTATTTAGSVSVGTGTGQAPKGRSIVGAAGSNVVQVFADGTNAVATVTITGTTAGSTTPVLLGTKKVTFYGAAAAISTPVLSVNAINGAAAATPLVAVANSGVLTATVTDAAGLPVPGASVYIVSGDKTKITDQYAGPYTSSATGVITAPLSGLAQGSTTVVATTNSASTVTTGISSAALTVRVGSNVVKTQTYAFDAASYVPGTPVTWTITAVDAAGLPVTDGTSVAWSLTSSSMPIGAVTTALPTTYKAGVATQVFYAPLVAGTLTITGSDTSGTTAAVTTQKAEIVGGAAVDAAQAAQDAANEATDAANAATDAANNAMDSADAATAAAQDAGDKADAALAAITDLATKVSDIATQVSALSALVSKIAAAVAKISAKVKA